jgi:NADH-quinone oxidoreductase subunit H
MCITFAAIAAGLVGLAWAFYWAAAGGAAAGVWLAGTSLGQSMRLSVPLGAYYGKAIVNTLTLMLVVVMILSTLLTVAERKWAALLQDRIGANRIKVFGLFSLAGLPFFIADAVKFLTKEDFRPRKAETFLYNLAPLLAFAPILMLIAIVPVGPEVRVGEHLVSLQIATPDAGMLWVFAIASLAVYGTALGGWASNNKLALLGGVRASSQMLSYEVSLGLSLVGCMMAYGTLRLDEMAAGQGKLLWGSIPAMGFLLQPLGFITFFVSAFAETKRAPFDMPEGESEIVGYYVEYSGMKFGMFMIGEFVEIAVLSAIVVAIFFGGWHPIVMEGWLKANLSPLAFASVCGAAFIAKMVFLCWLQLMIRWTFPRFRYDQVQRLCWKALLPLAILNIFVTGAAILLDPSLETLGLVGLGEIALVVLLTVAMGRKPAPAPAAHPAH